jgi:hypothetical protein
MAGIPLGGPTGGLYFKGEYATAGGQPTTPISRWDGHAWSTVPGSVYGNSRGLIGFDPDGPGPQNPLLYSMNRYWDGATWTDTGLANVWSLTVFDDDGAGPNLPELYACGSSLTYNGQAAGSVRRWNGGAWAPVGNIAGVIELASWDQDGSGPLPERLCSLTTSGVVSTFDGVAWNAVGPSAGAGPYTFAVFDEDGAGPLPPTVYVSLEHALRKFEGGSWVTIASLNSIFCSCAATYYMHVFDPPGSEPAGLYGTGYFTSLNGAPANAVFKWNGQVFSGLSGDRGLNGASYAMARFDDDGAGPGRESLFIGGAFTHAGSVNAGGIVRWNGSIWSAVGTGLAGGTAASFARALAVWDDDDAGPHAPRLIAGGRFATAGGVTVNHIASWDGTNWGALGSGFVGEQYADIKSIVVFDDDGAGPHASVVVAAGSFTTAGGNPATSGVAQWNGQAWTGLGTPPADSFFPTSLAVFDDDGSGPNPPGLYLGGEGGGGLYRWNGQAWVLVGGGLTRSIGNLVGALAVVDEDGPGPARASLWVAGQFSLAGGMSARNVARWDGQNWSAIGAGIGSAFDQVEFISVVDRTAGLGAPTVFAGGQLNGPLGATPVVVWNPNANSWVPVNGAPYAAFDAELFDDDGTGPVGAAVYFAGSFTSAGGVPSSNIARMTCRCYANCDGSTSNPVLNANDFQCFLSTYAVGSAAANCDGSTVQPVLNVNDFQCFMNAFAIGCS